MWALGNQGLVHVGERCKDEKTHNTTHLPRLPEEHIIHHPRRGGLRVRRHVDDGGVGGGDGGFDGRGGRNGSTTGQGHHERHYDNASSAAASGRG